MRYIVSLVLTALAVMLFALPAIADETNQVEYWETDGTYCVKDDNPTGYEWTPSAGAVLVVVKAGSGQTSGDPNAVYSAPFDEPLVAVDGKEISHVIECFPIATTTVPESSTTVPESSTTVPESSTTVPESSTTVPESSTTVPESSTTVPESSTTIPDDVIDEEELPDTGVASGALALIASALTLGGGLLVGKLRADG